VEAGYHEIQQARGAYRIADRAALSGLLGVPIEGPAEAHAERIEAALASGDREREAKWSESVAVGRRTFVEEMKRELASRTETARVAML
jgi:putative transposase